MTRPETRQIVRWLTGILAVAALALFWSSVWSDLDGSVLSRVPILDEAYYLSEAAHIADGRILPDDPFSMSPLYPYLVAATGSGREIGIDQVREGPPPHGIRALQALLWLGTAVLLWRVARRFVPMRFAWAAPALWLLYRPAAVYATSALLEVPLTFLALAALASATGRAPSRNRALGAGLLVGAAALLRFHAVLLIVPVVLALIDAADHRLRRGVVPAVLALLLLVLPVSVFNSLRAGRLVGPSLNGGINLYIGNGPEANGFYVTYRGFDPARDPTGRAFLSDRLDREVTDAAAAEQAWATEARRAVLDDPMRAVGLWLKKVRLHWVAAEIPQISPLDSWAREAPALRALVAPYGLLSVGGLFGLLLIGWRDARLRPWVIALLLLIAAQSVFFVVSRYRLVLVPILALLAALGLADLWTRRGRRLVVGAGLAGLCVLVVLPWGLAPSLRRLEAAGLVNEGVRWEHLADAGEMSGRTKALVLYDAALTLDQAHPEIYRAAARIHGEAGRSAAAEDVLRRGLMSAEPVDDVRRDLISLLIGTGRPGEALGLLDEHVRVSPDDVDMLHNYAIALSGADRGDEAERIAAVLIRTAPDDPRGYIDLGVMVARQGRLEEARAIFRRGLGRIPGEPLLSENLERVEAVLAE